MNKIEILFVSIILCFSFSSCQKPPEVVEEVKPVPVTVVKPEMKDISVTYSTSATIISDDARELSFAVGGTVKKIFKDEGETFSKGDVLAELDRTYLQNNLNAVSSNLSLTKKQH